MKYRIEKHNKKKIVLASEGINVSYTNITDEPEILGEIDLTDEELENVEIKVTGKTYKIKFKNKSK